MDELYKIYRPDSFDYVYGQDDTVSMLQARLEEGTLPHSILFTGGSGTGKTTIARILKKELKCSDSDFIEINASDFNGIATIRDIRSKVSLKPLKGGARIWLIDECHKLSSDAQNAFLKILEDTPEHAYFFLATTDPQKLLKTIKTRCTEILIRELDPKTMAELVTSIAEAEEIEISEEVMDKIVEVADGSARKALVLLDQIQDTENEEDQLNRIESVNDQKAAIDLCRALMNPKTRWADISPILKNIEGEPESIRRGVLGYCQAVLLGKGNHQRAYFIANAFRENVYDSGKPGLVLQAYEALNPSLQ